MNRLIYGATTIIFFMTISTALSQTDQYGMIQNGGLEKGDHLPEHWSQGASIPGVEYKWDRKTSFGEGSGSLCLHKTAQRFFPIAQWMQTIDLAEGESSISVSAQVKAERVSKAIIDIQFLDESGEWISHEWALYIGAKKDRDPPATHDWKKYKSKVKVPKNTSQIVVALQIYGPGKVWFDEISVTSGDARTAKRNVSRTWTDATGKYSVRAVFVSFKDGKVTLKRDDNSELVTLDLDRLSDACQEYVKSRR